LLNLAQEERDPCRLLSSAVGCCRRSVLPMSVCPKVISRNPSTDKNIADRRASDS
jgi:hypothetical protein